RIARAGHRDRAGAREPRSRRTARAATDRAVRPWSARLTERGWIDAQLRAARPRAIAALLRYFRDLDTAEEALQRASLRALETWPVKGPPRDPVAWLVLVGRNASLDEVRRRNR